MNKNNENEAQDKKKQCSSISIEVPLINKTTSDKIVSHESSSLAPLARVVTIDGAVTKTIVEKNEESNGQVLQLLNSKQNKNSAVYMPPSNNLNVRGRR